MINWGDDSRGTPSPPPELEPNEMAAWLKENKGMDVDPITVGKQARLLGYRTDFLFKDGKMRRFIRKNPYSVRGGI